MASVVFPLQLSKPSFGTSTPDPTFSHCPYSGNACPPVMSGRWQLQNPSCETYAGAVPDLSSGSPATGCTEPANLANLLAWPYVAFAMTHGILPPQKAIARSQPNTFLRIPGECSRGVALHVQRRTIVSCAEPHVGFGIGPGLSTHGSLNSSPSFLNVASRNLSPQNEYYEAEKDLAHHRLLIWVR